MRELGASFGVSGEVMYLMDVNDTSIENEQRFRDHAQAWLTARSIRLGEGVIAVSPCNDPSRGPFTYFLRAPRIEGPVTGIELISE